MIRASSGSRGRRPGPGLVVIAHARLPAGARMAVRWRGMAMGDELSVTVRRERGVAIAEVTGDMDMSTAAGLRERLSGLADSGQPLIVDLNRVTFIDSTGLGVLVSAARRATARG